jgi:hypothetical protein
MLPRATLSSLLGVLLAWSGCDKTSGGDTVGSAFFAGPGSAAKAGSGSGGGFSSDLAKELGPGGAAKSGSDTARGSAAARAGSAAGAAAGSDPRRSGGSAQVPAPLASGSDPASPGPPAAKAGSAASKADDPAVEITDVDSKPAPPPAGDAAKPANGAKPGGPPGSVKAVAAPPPSSAPGSRGPVTGPGDLAAIKLSLLPNWDRDVDQPGTFQYVVRIKGTRSTKTFSFRYGYDDPRAPVDREQYKKYLQDSKALMGEIKDRQRGSAWFLEGTDGSGLPAFRYVVLYGGKRLICYGSQYKDADANRLGDDRDQTVIQAKQICETLAL